MGNLTGQKLWQATLETLQMTLASSIIAFVIALPLGILLVVTKKNGLLQNRPINIFVGIIINILRSIPFAILLIYAMPLTRAIIGRAVGTWAMVVPLTLSAAPFMARLVESSLASVEDGLIEAAKSMGATRLQIISKVYIHESLPHLILSATIGIVAILGYTAMANIIGAGGLGDLAFTEGYLRYQQTVILLCLVILVLLTQAIQWLGVWLHKILNKKK